MVIYSNEKRLIWGLWLTFFGYSNKLTRNRKGFSDAMSESNSENSLKIPKWDGKWETCPRYLVQVEALDEYYECVEAMDETDMANCPTKSEYTVLDLTIADGKVNAKLYKQNKRICAIMVIGQGSDHGLAVIQKMKTTDHPHWMAWKIVVAMKNKNKPKDASAKIEMDD